MYELTELLARAAGLPLQSNMTYPWDGSKAHQRVIAWATTDGKIDKAKASQGFGYVTGDGSKSGDYHFGFCDVINGRLEVIHNALQTCLSSLNGGRTGQKVVPAAEVPALINFFEGQLKRFHTKQTNAESGTPQGDGGAGEEEGYDPLAAAQDAHLADSQGDNQDASSKDGRERIAMPDGNEALVKRIEEQTAVILKAQARIEALEEAGRQRDESTKEERALLAQAGVGTVVDLFTKIQAEGAEKDATIAELTQKLSDAEKAREELQAQKDVADAEVQAAKGSQMYAEVRKRYAEDIQPKIEAVCMKRARHEELTEEDFNVWAQVSLPATPPDGTAVPTPKPMEVTAGRDGSIAELCDPIYAEAEKLQGEGKFVDAGAKNRWVYERLDAVQAFRNGAK